MENNVLICRTSDGVDFTLPVEIVLSKMISLPEEPKENMIKLSAVKSTELQLIAQYCEYHKYQSPPVIIKPLQHNDLKKCVSDEWDANLINSLDLDRVTELLIAAESLKCLSLMDLCYARLALYFRVTPIPELKKAYLLTDSEFTEQEIKEIKEGNNWLMTLTEDRLNELNNI